MTQSTTARRDKVTALVIAALTIVILYQAIARVPAADTAASVAPVCPETITLTRPYRKVDFTTDFYGMRYHGNSANELDLIVLLVGAWEKYILFFMRDTLQKGAGAEGVFLDIGANVGQHSMYMSKFAKQVHAFEPYQPVLKTFHSMVEDNKLSNVAIHPVGLGDEPATLPFYAPPDNNLGTGSFVQSFSDRNRPAESLQIVVGDTALAEAGVERVDLIKLDIEGYERPALKGLRKTLEKHRPIVVMEITIDPKQPQLFDSTQSLLAAFPEGYDFRMFERKREHTISGEYHLLKVVLDFQTKQQQDLVLFPVEKRGLIQLQGGGEKMNLDL